MFEEEKKYNEEKLRMLLTRITDAPESALYSIGFYEETAKKELEIYNKNELVLKIDSVIEMIQFLTSIYWDT